jgi:cytochrome oxidase Cu insertion factor (SCO1/SenC/PrrC family)
MKPTSKLKSRLMLLLIFAVGAAPAIAALVWYFNADDWRPVATTNHGDLITPPRAIKTAPLPLMDRGTLPADWFRGQWSLVYAEPGECPRRCKKALYLTRQIRLALGAKMNRVQRLFVATGSAAHAAALRRAHPDLTVVEVDDPAGRNFLAQITTAGEPGAHIWLVDPRGRVMMVYRVSDDPNGVVADLKHLLKYSQLG